jgi:hypothetical protein
VEVQPDKSAAAAIAADNSGVTRRLILTVLATRGTRTRGPFTAGRPRGLPVGLRGPTVTGLPFGRPVGLRGPVVTGRPRGRFGLSVSECDIITLQLTMLGEWFP